MNYKSLLLLFALFAVTASQAQISHIQEIKTTNIDALRIKQSPEASGKSVVVLSAKEIDALPVNSFDDLLKYVTGIEVQQRGPLGAQGDISIRGTTFNQSLVLIDGVRLNETLTGHFNAYVPVPLSAIERVEIVKGAASAKYGPDAVGGVINIITKKSSRGDKRISLDTEFNWGSYNTFENQSFLHVQDNNVYLNVGLGTLETDGEELVNPNFGENPVADSTYNNDVSVSNLSFQLGAYLGSRWHINTFHGMDDRDFNAKYFYTRSVWDESRERAHNSWHQFNISRSGDHNILEFSAVYKRTTDHFAFNPLFTPNDHVTKSLQFRINNHRYISDKLNLNIGADFDRRSIVSNDRGDHDNWRGGAFAIAYLKPVKNLHLTGSVRADYDEVYEWNVSPQLNAAFIGNRFLIRGSIGLTNRAPDYTERFVSNNLESLTPGRNLGNPELSAENSVASEIGLEIKPIDDLKISTTFFNRNAHDLIDFALTDAQDINIVGPSLDPAGQYFFATNISSLNTKGLESEINWTRKWSKKNQLNVQVGHIFIESSNGDNAISKYIANHAKHMITTNVGLRLGNLTWNVNGLWKERNPETADAINAEITQSYTVWNTELSLVPKNSGVGFQFGLYNIFNQKYEDILGAPMNRRWFMGGFRLRFDRKP